jgi:hypothetical protein
MDSSTIQEIQINTVVGVFSGSFIVFMFVNVLKRAGLPGGVWSVGAAILGSVGVGLMWAAVQPGPMLKGDALFWVNVILIILSTAFISTASYEAARAISKSKESDAMAGSLAELLQTSPDTAKLIAKLQVQPIPKELIPVTPPKDEPEFLTDKQQYTIVNTNPLEPTARVEGRGE